jgi:hypothetical protein
MNPPGTERLLDFRDPDERVWRQIDRALRDLTIADPAAVDSAEVADRESCLSRVKAAITKDHAANVREEPDEPWEFDYVVELENDNTLNVMTRLQSKDDTSQGAVFYGLSVVRLAPNEYAISSDYD